MLLRSRRNSHLSCGGGTSMHRLRYVGFETDRCISFDSGVNWVIRCRIRWWKWGGMRWRHAWHALSATGSSGTPRLLSNASTHVLLLPPCYSNPFFFFFFIVILLVVLGRLIEFWPAFGGKRVFSIWVLISIWGSLCRLRVNDLGIWMLCELNLKLALSICLTVVPSV